MSDLKLALFAGLVIFGIFTVLMLTGKKETETEPLDYTFRCNIDSSKIYTFGNVRGGLLLAEGVYQFKSMGKTYYFPAAACMLETSRQPNAD